MIGSNVGEEGQFSLSSDRWELDMKSLENAGLVGVAGISSERSDAVVDTLVGVLAFDECVRIGVMGRGAIGSRWNRPPSR